MRENHHLLRVSVLPPRFISGCLTSSSHAINGLSFSHDGEYLAISNTSTYIDIVSLSLA